jgi:hypothetical protein
MEGGTLLEAIIFGKENVDYDYYYQFPEIITNIENW